MAARSYKPWLHGLLVVIWISSSVVAVESYLRHRDNLSIAMVCIGAAAISIHLIGLRFNL
jgi:hypothetical protein